LRFESSGLAAAYRLKAAGVAVTVFETQNAVGGKIQSFSQNGLIWEKGPNTMVHLYGTCVHEFCIQ
jgi:protoporphyrinogen oxidase